MSADQPFLSPRMAGGRFDDNAVPLELLKDISVLGDMITETAKNLFLSESHGRKRVPRGFTEGISLKLSAIRPGSACLEITLIEKQDQQESFLPKMVRGYLELGRDLLLQAIDAAYKNEPVPERMPDNVLLLFDKFGRGLRDDEVIEFRPHDKEHPARYTKDTRHRLVLASSRAEVITEEICLIGLIPEADQKNMTFEIDSGGYLYKAPMEDHYMDTVMEAFNNYRNGQKVRLQGIGRFTRSNRLQQIESVEHLTILDPNDVPMRIGELRNLSDGWLDGEGCAPSPDVLSIIEKHFANEYPDELPLPYIYPTPEGGLLLEWTLPPYELSLEILPDMTATWYSLNTDQDNYVEQQLDIRENSAWNLVYDHMHMIEGALS